MERRDLLKLGIWTLLIQRIDLAGAWPKDPAHWLRELSTLCRALRQGDIKPTQWVTNMHALYGDMSPQYLAELIDFQQLQGQLKYPEGLAAVRNVAFPNHPKPGKSLGVGAKIFSLQQDSAIIPHGHNAMVSAHYVLQGRFRVRTYQRHFEQEDPASPHLIISPHRDEIFGPGDLLAMSDDDENIHWLIAETSTAATFDVPVTRLATKRTYTHEANRYSMIFCDPTAKSDGSGQIAAPILNFEQARARFG